MAHVFSKAGEEGLRELLTHIETDKEKPGARCCRAVGLPDVATIVMEAAANAFPAHVMHCPYAATDIRNYQSWMGNHQRKQSHRNSK